MPQFRPKAMLERTAAADLVKNTVSKIPTIFGRLAYLASLRDPNSGIYYHHGLGAIFGRDQSRKALAETHENVFHQWLSMALEEKYVDLQQYLAALEEPSISVLAHWSNNQAYRGYYPSSARKSEKELYFGSMEMMRSILNSKGRGS